MNKPIPICIYHIIISYLVIGILFHASALADYFPTPSPTPLVCDFLGKITINDQPANPGDEIAFWDASGNICGKYIVKRTDGNYGFLHVYASANATLSVMVWDNTSKQLYQKKQVVLSPGELQGTAHPSSVPPIFQQNARYVLNISAHNRVNDINKDGILNIIDVISLLQYLSK